MEFREAIDAINAMVSDGVVDIYAISGDAATSLYLPSVRPRFMEVLIPIASRPGDLIVSPSRVFEYLLGKGGIFEGQYMRVGDTPILFVPPTTPLLEEAMHHADTREVDGTVGRFVTADYLAAIAFQSGRANARVLELAAADVLDVDRFQAIVTNHGMLERWREFVKNQR